MHLAGGIIVNCLRGPSQKLQSRWVISLAQDQECPRIASAFFFCQEWWNMWQGSQRRTICVDDQTVQVSVINAGVASCKGLKRYIRRRKIAKVLVQDLIMGSK